MGFGGAIPLGLPAEVILLSRVITHRGEAGDPGATCLAQRRSFLQKELQRWSLNSSLQASGNVSLGFSGSIPDSFRMHAL